MESNTNINLNNDTNITNYTENFEKTAKENKNNNEEKNNINFSSFINNNLDINNINVLSNSVKCKSLYMLFKELVRSNIETFFIKLAVLFVFSQDEEKVKWKPKELADELYWLKKDVRRRILLQLSKSGWISYKDGYYELSTFGRNILSMLVTLVQQEKVPEALGTNISSLSLTEMYKHDPTNTLRMFLNELVRIDKEIEETLESKSPYLIMKLDKKVKHQFNIAVKSRKYLEKLKKNDYITYRLKQEIHDKLSSFHEKLSTVQKIQNELIGRRIILADKSLSQHDIEAFLINSSLEDIAKIGKKYISMPILVKDLVPQLMIYETEWQLGKIRPSVERRGWSEVELASESKESLVKQSKFLQFIGEINNIFSQEDKFKIEEFIPRTNWSISGLRFSLLSVLESGEIPPTLGSKEKCPEIEVKYPDMKEDDISLPSVFLNDYFSGVKEITKGEVWKKDKENKEKKRIIKKEKQVIDSK